MAIWAIIPRASSIIIPTGHLHSHRIHEHRITPCRRRSSTAKTTKCTNSLSPSNVITFTTIAVRGANLVRHPPHGMRVKALRPEAHMPIRCLVTPTLNSPRLSLALWIWFLTACPPAVLMEVRTGVRTEALLTFPLTAISSLRSPMACPRPTSSTNFNVSRHRRRKNPRRHPQPPPRLPPHPSRIPKMKPSHDWKSSFSRNEWNEKPKNSLVKPRSKRPPVTRLLRRSVLQWRKKSQKKPQLRQARSLEKKR
ncbi:hypothetical protein I7I53_11562 [Histoplasma capsulatum var. duboisii H88]|uniref:Uncharacterized protein n=1 Tax=Ajellomyces capsulatus (strain H88) TaxID=544711 RepID=A0A8A1LXX3_AJEC8|nr:hypothetical protein I7I53_11562 [Histoplasma capsulatum var. duboisii H88]